MDQANFERIEAFILKRMNEQERKAFLQEMVEDDELRSEVALQTEMIHAIETESMQATLSAMHDEHFGEASRQNKRQGVFRLPRGWAIAASVAALITVGWFLLRNSEAASTDQLYTQYYSTDPGLPTTLNLQKNRPFVEGMIDYKMGKAEAAIERWRPLLQGAPSNDTLQYYLGMAYLEADQINLAVKQLEQVELSSTSFSGRAQWYLALAHLKNANTTEAIRLLRQIAEGDDGEFRDQAKQLLLDLED